MKIYTLIFLLSAGIAACTNSPSDTAKESSEIHESMSMHGDTVSQQTSGFTTAMHQMMNDMHQIPMSGNVDKDFAIMMKSHHQGAVEMSQYQITNGKDETLKNMAVKIDQEQKAEIKELERIIESLDKAPKNYDPKKKESGFAQVLDENMQMMMDMSKMDTSMATDHQFVAMMIPHHQSAVHMAEGFVQYGKDERLLNLAKKIIVSQKKEIIDFNNWMNRNKK
ncbi:DUF305 domain-containing protein [Daejeonella oryzae]|uniref:DUF305 domain-containing protein n=1 Tax=Daejeonella oryzae TaxID=1122943 RepID=UPI00138AFEBF|nr:DUF305 domain-containing protein [Daejeonella oryzae]